MSVRVLVVEDEELAAEAHATYTSRVPGFEVAGVVPLGRRGAALPRGATPTSTWCCSTCTSPTATASACSSALSAAGHRCDVIAVTSARDSEVVRRAVSHGVVQYLLKPFTFAAFRTKLEQYAAYRAQLAGTASDVVQDDVDQLFGVAAQPSGRCRAAQGDESRLAAPGHHGRCATRPARCPPARSRPRWAPPA